MLIYFYVKYAVLSPCHRWENDGFQGIWSKQKNNFQQSNTQKWNGESLWKLTKSFLWSLSAIFTINYFIQKCESNLKYFIESTKVHLGDTITETNCKLQMEPYVCSSPFWAKYGKTQRIIS